MSDVPDQTTPTEGVTETVNLVQSQDIPVFDEVTECATHGSHVGQVKWFNPKLGYGFITVVDGDDKGKDIFVHHSGIKPSNSNYKTLEKGEYIQFNVTTGNNGLQAVDITGIKGGPLMCDFVVKRPMVSSHRTSVVPPPPPPRTTHKWQSVPTRSQTKNKLKYSKEGREMMKARV